MQEAAPGPGPQLPYICGYDGEKGDISVDLGSPHFAVHPPLFDIVVCQRPRIDVIVGDLACKAKQWIAK